MVMLRSLKKKMAISEDTMMDMLVANTLRMLSAYLTTNPIRSPPYAWAVCM